MVLAPRGLDGVAKISVPAWERLCESSRELLPARISAVDKPSEFLLAFGSLVFLPNKPILD